MNGWMDGWMEERKEINDGNGNQACKSRSKISAVQDCTFKAFMASLELSEVLSQMLKNSEDQDMKPCLACDSPGLACDSPWVQSSEPL